MSNKLLTIFLERFQWLYYYILLLFYLYIYPNKKIHITSKTYIISIFIYVLKYITEYIILFFLS